MDNTTRRQLQSLMQDPRWPAIEKYTENYLRQNFLKGGAKKDTEFDTMWYIAFDEGGKHHVQKFMNALEDEALRAE